MKPFFTYCLTASLPFTIANCIASSAQSPISSNYGNLPLSFEANHGQASPGTQFLSHGRGYTLALSPSEAAIALSSANSSAKPDDARSLVRITLSGANAQAASTPEDQQITRTNYFLGADPRNWRTDIPNYGRIRYTAVYPGIDLVYYGNQHRLEHDFVIAPHADPTQIALDLHGASNLRIDPATGDLILRSSPIRSSQDAPQLRLLKPVAYQQSNGTRITIPSHYKMLAHNRIGFTLAAYNHAQPLIIDPILSYATYLGGSGVALNGNGVNGDQANGIAVDSAGNAYILGTAYSADFPTTAKAFQTHPSVAAGQSTVFVSKLNPSGTALLYSTYLGGTGTATGGDFGYGIAVSPGGEAFITGATYSTDFPITCGAIHIQNLAAPSSHGTTAFVTHLASGGNALLYSTYLGGTGPDVAQAIAVDSLGDAYVTGYTASPNFPVTSAAFQRKFTAVRDHAIAFVSRLNPTGTALQYSTYLGGAGPDAPNAIVLDSAGNAYIAGSTKSSGFPVTAGAVQPSLTGPQNAFVTKLDPTLKTELYSTFLGGSGSDSAQALTIDSQHNAYVAGTTTSSDFPLTEGTVEGTGILAQSESVTLHGPAGFLTKLNPTASAETYSTYIQGHGTAVTGIALDSSGAVYLSGTAATPGVNIFGGFQVTPDALPTPASTGTSAFLLKLDPAATVYNYATLLGGGSNDGATSLAMNSAGNLYLAGYSTSPDFPVTTGALQKAKGGGPAGGISNAFVGAFALQSEAAQVTYPTLPTNIATSLSYDPGSAEWVPGDDYALFLNLTLTLGAPGPPPTGTITITAVGYSATLPIGDGYTGGDFITAYFYGGWNEPFGIGGLAMYDVYSTPDASSTWQLWYSGDSVYQPATIIGTAKLLPIVPDSRPASTFTGKVTPRAASNMPAPGSLEPHVFTPKFTPATAALSATASQNQPVPEATAACIVPQTLTVTTDSAFRIYGAANPKLTYHVAGLVGTDSVNVALHTSATPASPVGSYPIAAIVTGADVSNYILKEVVGTLSVRPIPLRVNPNPATRGVTYGKPIPAMSGFTATGFINGDTQAVITGAPILSTTATSASPVGLYPLNLATGTLAAANYSFDLMTGRFYIYKATLIGTIQNVTIHRGDPIPAFTYTLTGFVNGDTQASAVTGSPILSTKATSTSPPGKYKITAALGTLASQNYNFHPVLGTLTILP